MDNPNKENEDIIEDITEEQLDNEEVEQDTEVTEEASEESAVTESELSDTIKDILLGEKAKKEDDEEDKDDEEDEVEEDAHDDEEDDKKKKDVKESAKKDKKEGEHEDDEDEDEDEEEDLDEATAASTLKPQNKSAMLQAAYQKLKAMKKASLKSAYEAHCENTAAAKTLRPGSSKLDILNAMYKEMQRMTKSSLKASYDGLDKFQDDKQKAIFKGESADISDALNTLIENDSNLSEEFKTQASTLFEAAIAKKVVEVKEDLEIQYHEELQEEVDNVRDVLVEKIDNYLSYVVESWIEENEEQVTTTLRTEIAENFISSLKDVFVENYLEIPEEKRDLVEELAEKAESSQEALTEAQVEVEVLKDQIENYERNEVISEASNDLSENESYKLKEILEDIEFGDKESFTSKVKVIKSSLFNINEETTDEVVEDVNSETEVIIEGDGDPLEKLPAHMKAYVKALSKK